jgi:hypothetical protein
MKCILPRKQMFLHLALHALVILAFFYCMLDFCREIVKRSKWLANNKTESFSLTCDKYHASE